jgi:hypothetical protein
VSRLDQDALDVMRLDQDVSLHGVDGMKQAKRNFRYVLASLKLLRPVFFPEGGTLPACSWNL